jgi:hypothetical protein
VGFSTAYVDHREAKIVRHRNELDAAIYAAHPARLGRSLTAVDRP